MMCSGAYNLKSKLLSKCFSTILIIAACIFFVNSQGMADPIFKSVGTLKASKIKKLKVPIVRVSVPVQISDLAAPWRDADLVVAAEVLFYKGYYNYQTGDGGEGYAIGRTIKSKAFTNGSTQGMVHVFLNEVYGITTGQYVAISVALAKLGDQCKVLGYGWNFPGGLPTEMKEKFEENIDTVISWEDMF
ncbi:MAG: hypothetical protein K8R67_16540 [Desulfobacteraceae bacterium]|nr:hypothetical protein [Desulfobacteraceae bacterium]